MHVNFFVSKILKHFFNKKYNKLLAKNKLYVQGHATANEHCGNLGTTPAYHGTTI